MLRPLDGNYLCLWRHFLREDPYHARQRRATRYHPPSRPGMSSVLRIMQHTSTTALGNLQPDRLPTRRRLYRSFVHGDLQG